MTGVTRATFAELLAMPGVIEECQLRSRFGFMAYHGGALEAHTDVIARGAAERSGASYYGVIQPQSVLVHVPSTAVSPTHSETLAGFIDHVDIVVTIHGFGRHPLPTSLLIGGQNRTLATHVTEYLRPALPGYIIVDDLDHIPAELRGVHKRNPVNLPRRTGVQIELPARIRGTADHADSLIEALARATLAWPT